MKTWKDIEIDNLYARYGGEKGVKALAERFGINEASWYLRALAVIKALKAAKEW